jgi:hypothetical protein
MYTEFLVGKKEYKLRLNTRNVVALEKKLGCNPLGIFGTDGETIPTVGVMIDILHASLQAYEHNITYNDACDIFDAWIAEGHSTVDFIYIILDVYKASGIVPKEVETNEKN